MEITLTSTTGGKASSLKLSPAVFETEFNEPLVHQVVTAYLANGHDHTRKQKNRSEVRGGGKKPWRQKGTGRARAGTIRGPIWRGGGVTFAVRPQEKSKPKYNRKMYHGAMRSILAELNRQGRLMIIDSLAVAEPKTKLLRQTLEGLGITQALIVVDEVERNLHLASKNLPGIDVRDVIGADVVSLVGAEKVVLTEAAYKKFEEVLA